MDSVKFDFSGFETGMTKIIENLKPDPLLREVCSDIMPIMVKRIHTFGLASNNEPIGEYADSYLKLRERKGLGSSMTVKLFFTRKLRNSWTISATDEGYGIGFIDESASASAGGETVTSLDKVVFAEQHFAKKIFDMTDDETKLANELIVEYTQKYIDDAGNQ